MLFSTSMSADSQRTDRGLIVKCQFDNARKKISFRSSQNCTFVELKHKVDRCFSLSSVSYTISWKDDYGETVHIYSDEDLTEAISYFCGGDDAPSSSGSSIFSGFGRGKDVVMNVFVIVDYDGPSLSDTSSLASLDDYRSSSSNTRSFSFGGSQSLEPEDDCVTVSSKDRYGSSASYSTSSQGPRLFSSSSGSSQPSHFPDVSPTVRYSNNLSPSDSISVLNDRVDESQFSFSRIGSLSSSQSSISRIDETSDARERYPEDPSAVFERLRIREAAGDSISDWQSGSEDRGARWLRDQVSRDTLAGGIPKSPSGSSDDDDAFHNLSLAQNTNGNFYYNYTDSSQSHALLDDERSRLLQSDDGHPIAGPSSERMARPRPSSMHIGWVLAQQQELEENERRQQASASMSTLTPDSSFGQKSKLAPVQEDTAVDVIYYNLPVPPSDIVTDCSNCGILLETFRYVCSTCGEKAPFISCSTQTAARNGGTSVTSSPSCGHNSYPPPQLLGSPPPASSSPTQSLVGSTETLLTAPRKFYQNIVEGHSLSNSILSSFSRSDSTPQEIRIPDAPSIGVGYELCPSCLESDGNAHAIDAALGSPSSGDSIMNRSTASLVQDPTWRTAAPKKGLIRHAYIEKMWGEFGWENICQEENLISVCSICSATTESQRYKCAICSRFNLCSACFTMVHLYHPAHPFILAPDAPNFSQGGIESLVTNPFDAEEERSMEHRVTCAHCLMPIVGALFHCAFCESVDICSNCEAAGLPGNLESVEGGHNSSHILLKIPYVMEPSTLRKASKAAIRRWRGRDSAIAISFAQRTSQRNAAHTETIIGGKATSSYPVSPDDHDMACSSCHEPIIGVRYQCCHCPSYPTPYSLCANCEKKSWAVHEPMHAFFKLPRPVNCALQSRLPFLPPLYSNPAGPPPSNPRCDEDPEAYLAGIYHSSVRCDLCFEPVIGAWYRCAYCSKDLCHQCQTVDKHAPDHIFVVLKSTIDTTALREWISDENPKPIIDYPIY